MSKGPTNDRRISIGRPWPPQPVNVPDSHVFIAIIMLMDVKPTNQPIHIVKLQRIKNDASELLRRFFITN